MSDEHWKEEARELAELVRAVVGDGPFRPFAVFDKELDRVVVQWRDCSVVEVEIAPELARYDDMHAGERECVGFEIRGVGFWCRTYGVDMGLVLALVDCLDALLAGNAPDTGQETADA